MIADGRSIIADFTLKAKLGGVCPEWGMKGVPEAEIPAIHHQHPTGVRGLFPLNYGGQPRQSSQQHYLILLVDNLVGIKVGMQVMGEQDGKLAFLCRDGFSRR